MLIFTRIFLTTIVKNYKISLQIDKETLGETIISFKSPKTNEIFLNTYFDVQKVYYNDAEINFTKEENGIKLEDNFIDDFFIKVIYKKELKNVDEDYLVTGQNLDDGYKFFPYFNFDGLATYTLNIACKKHLNVISNSQIKNVILKNDLQVVNFEESLPIGYAMFYFVLGKFEFAEIYHKSTIIRVYVQKNTLKKSVNSLSVISDILSFYEKYFMVDYYLPKLDIVVLPELNPSGITITGLVLLNGDKFYLGGYYPLIERANLYLLAHELGHLWVGSLVMIKKLSYAWLNEALVEYFSALPMQIEFTRIKADFDSENKNNPQDNCNCVNQPITTTNDVNQPIIENNNANLQCNFVNQSVNFNQPLNYNPPTNLCQSNSFINQPMNVSQCVCVNQPMNENDSDCISQLNPQVNLLDPSKYTIIYQNKESPEKINKLINKPTLKQEDPPKNSEIPSISFTDQGLENYIDLLKKLENKINEEPIEQSSDTFFTNLINSFETQNDIIDEKKQVNDPSKIYYDLSLVPIIDKYLGLEHDLLYDSHPVLDLSGNDNFKNNNYDFTTYFKGSGIVRMVEDYVGYYSFRKIMNDYLVGKKFKLVGYKDFLDYFDEESQSIFMSFLNNKLFPLVKVGEIYETNYLENKFNEINEIELVVVEFNLLNKNKPTNKFIIPVKVNWLNSEEDYFILEDVKKISKKSDLFIINGDSQGLFITQYPLNFLYKLIETNLPDKSLITIINDYYLLALTNRVPVKVYLNILSKIQSKNFDVLNEIFTKINKLKDIFEEKGLFDKMVNEFTKNDLNLEITNDFNTDTTNILFIFQALMVRNKSSANLIKNQIMNSSNCDFDTEKLNDLFSPSKYLALVLLANLYSNTQTKEGNCFDEDKVIKYLINKFSCKSCFASYDSLFALGFLKNKKKLFDLLTSILISDRKNDSFNLFLGIMKSNLFRKELFDFVRSNWIDLTDNLSKDLINKIVTKVLVYYYESERDLFRLVDGLDQRTVSYVKNFVILSDTLRRFNVVTTDYE